MHRVWLLFLFLFLAGCAPPPDTLAKCQFETQKSYPTESVVLSARTRSFMELCMKAEGFTWTMAGTNCHLGFTDKDNPYTSAACYQATWFHDTRASLAKLFPKWILEKQ